MQGMDWTMATLNPLLLQPMIPISVSDPFPAPWSVAHVEKICRQTMSCQSTISPRSIPADSFASFVVQLRYRQHFMCVAPEVVEGSECRQSSDEVLMADHPLHVQKLSAY